jgi:hypothetical protein
MASGHVNRTNRPNTWPHRPACDVKFSLANPEPSTHGTARPFPQLNRMSAIGAKRPKLTWRFRLRMTHHVVSAG